MAGIDEPDALQWPKDEGKVNNGKFAVKGKPKSDQNERTESGHDEEGRIIPVEDKEDDGRNFPCPKCDFVFLRQAFQMLPVHINRSIRIMPGPKIPIGPDILGNIRGLHITVLHLV